MTYYASPAAYAQPTQATPAGNPMTPPQSEGFIPYTIDSMRLGLQNLSAALSQDFQSLNAFGQQNFPATAPWSNDPAVIAQRNAELGPFAGPAGLLESIDPTSPSYNPNALQGLLKWLLIGAGIFLAIELAPTINSLTAQRRHD